MTKSARDALMPMKLKIKAHNPFEWSGKCFKKKISCFCTQNINHDRVMRRKKLHLVLSSAHVS
jgi:hypothetical protein